jgi:hypothetical protein
MVHLPINHPLQPFYRLLAGLTGAYVLAFGIVGVIRTGGRPFFAQDDLPYVLGLHANRAFAIVSIVVGAGLVASVLIGGRVHRWVSLGASLVFLIAGLVMLVLERTDANFLGFTPITSVVSFIIGLVLLIAGLYGKVGSMLDVRRRTSATVAARTRPTIASRRRTRPTTGASNRTTGGTTARSGASRSTRRSGWPSGRLAGCGRTRA